MQDLRDVGRPLDEETSNIGEGMSKAKEGLGIIIQHAIQERSNFTDSHTAALLVELRKYFSELTLSDKEKFKQINTRVGEILSQLGIPREM
jgi:hypothetical protein